MSVLRAQAQFTGDLVRWMGGGKIAFVRRASGSHVKIRGFKAFLDLVLMTSS